MSTKLIWTGLEDLKQQLRALPGDLVGEGVNLVNGAATRAAARIVAKYPIGTAGRFYRGREITPGGLRRGVRVSPLPSNAYGVGKLLSSNAPHAWIFERGTKDRSYTMDRSAKHPYATGKVHRLGAMPAGRVFVPERIRAQGEVDRGIAALLRAHGLVVIHAGT
jgi:hypothetical protein